MKHYRLMVLVAAPLVVAGARGESLLPEMTPEQVALAERTIESFKTNPRGPFYRIRWFCNDGTDHPASPYPCGERGGGRQHASVSAEALALKKLNVDVGTIFAAMTEAEFWDAERDHHRLKELVLERYLEQVDNGWIYRRANTYRGARQAEDEEKAGRRLLTSLLSSPDWTRRRFFLAQQAVAATPHGLPDSAVKRVRTLAQNVAEADARFQPLRAKIHSNPDDTDLAAVEAYIAERNAPESVAKTLRELASLLRDEKAGRSLAARLPAMRKIVAGSPLQQASDALGEAMAAGDSRRIFSAGARFSEQIAREVMVSGDGSRNLDLLDFNLLIQELAFQTATELKPETRMEGLELLDDHFRYLFGAGLISSRQFVALEAELKPLLGAGEVEAEGYFGAMRYLGRSAEWARATAARELGPVSARFARFEPDAAQLLDHVLRSSPAFALSRTLEPLAADAGRAVGVRHSVFGVDSARGISGLNPGRAEAALEIWHGEKPVRSDRIYVVPQTASDLAPMAGVLTLDSGNALSHTQLLAANLGIPNAVVPSSLLAELEAREGEPILFEVSPNGAVTLREAARREETVGSQVERIDLDVNRMRLDHKELTALKDLSSEDAGVICGPKAANLGRLAQLFPDYVAPGFIVPFGVYLEHVSRPLGGDVEPLTTRIFEAFSRAESMRDGGASEAEVMEYISPELARFRELITGMELLPELEQRVRATLRERFGPEGSYGVFIRSDTNAEDLPQFTGAGLNRTVPNQVGEDAILEAIKEVWASPFSERAYAWRSRVLNRQDRVYPSVLIQKTVAAEKSGVIATVDLETGDRDAITVNVNEGVSAVVDGGVAESLLLTADGDVRLLQQARAAYRKMAAPSGGFRLLPPVGDDMVLRPEEVAEVRRLVAQVKERYPPVEGPDGLALPWDIEFGFELGEARLFQIRPLVRFEAPRSVEGAGVVDLGGRI